MARAQLSHLLKEHPTDFWRLLSPPWAPVGATVKALASHFEALLYHGDLKAPAVVLLDPPSDEPGATDYPGYPLPESYQCWPMPSPLPLPPPLTPASPRCISTMLADAPPAWTTIVMVDGHDQPCVEVQGYPLRPSYIPGALGLSSSGEIAGTLLSTAWMRLPTTTAG